jgi:TonB family protein
MTQPPTRPHHHRLGYTALLAFSLFYLIQLIFPWVPACSAASGPDARHLRESVRFDLHDHEVTGVFPLGHPLTLSVRLTGPYPSKADVVAIVESPGLPMRLIPMGGESARSERAALITLESLPAGNASPPPKAWRIDVTFAYLQGMHLHRFQRSTLYLTLGTPTIPISPRPGTVTDHGSLSDSGIPGGILRENTEPIVDGMILEEDLLGAKPLVRGNSYWEEIDDRIRRHWKHRLPHQGKVKATRSPTVHFQLYPNGEAQLVQVERSSKDFWVDLAALEAVVAAHPFPPFPPDLSDPHLEVHVELQLSTP